MNGNNLHSFLAGNKTKILNTIYQSLFIKHFDTNLGYFYYVGHSIGRYESQKIYFFIKGITPLNRGILKLLLNKNITC